MAKGPGKAYRRGMSLVEAVEYFSDEVQVEQHFIRARWPNGVACPSCGSLSVKERATRKPQPFRCGDCGLDFSVKTGTVMHGSNLPLRKWGLAIYLLTTNLKGVSSMKLHRDLGVTQKTAWHLAHRIRRAWESKQGLFGGPVEVDETYVGGKTTGRGHGPHGKGKAIVVGLKDQETKQVVAEVIPDTTRLTLHRFVMAHVKQGAKLYTDGWQAYVGIPLPHARVHHTQGQYVTRDGATTNGIESFWAMLKKGYHGVYHHMSAKHLARYVTEFAGRHNDRPADTLAQVEQVIHGMHGKRLRYSDLVKGV